MPKVTAWHSVEPGVELVYHDESECYYGTNVERRFVRTGRGEGRRQCHTCARLESRRSATAVKVRRQ